LSHCSPRRFINRLIVTNQKTQDYKLLPTNLRRTSRTRLARIKKMFIWFISLPEQTFTFSGLYKVIKTLQNYLFLYQKYKKKSYIFNIND